ncbi:hemolysin III family protein [Sedimentibacter sp. zth1]|uniref:PAQR family membrane homeostasis protein TrhA n=1 Tax=Sedimentibacter sp. zth1 TaxID=2816908 RepID=UPI001A914828|nr:hemolysin III family protein [Sedimentibacter sp. zth1]QSX06586.1 hemolysin III family protein [Sedimentibacter sp. zth1]
MRTKLADRQLPNYTRGEEIFNMVSHIVGSAFGIVALTLCIIVSVKNNNTYGLISSSIYGATMILLYTMSSIYHGLKNGLAKKVFQVLDHCTIYLLIAGSYTPIALSSIRIVSAPVAWTMFGIEWGLTALAVTLTAIDLKKYDKFSMVCYIVMGWAVVFFCKTTIQAITINGFFLLLAGGILYTIGSILYGLGKRKKYMHNIFHVFVLFGSLLHFFCIIFYVL